MKTNQRGIVQVWLVIVLAVAAIGSGVVAVKKGLGIFGGEDTTAAKRQAAEIADNNARLQAAQAEAAALRARAEQLAVAAAAQKQQRYDAAAEDVAGVVIALKQEETPSLNVTAALSLAQSAQTALDPVSEAKLAAMAETVKQLTAANATLRASAQAALAAREAAIEQGRTREQGLAAQIAAVAAEKRATESSAKLLSDRLTNEIGEHARTSAQLKTVGEKLFSFLRWSAVAAGLIVGLLWVLPVVAKAFPGAAWLGWVAKKGGLLLAGGLHALHTAETRAAHAGLQRVGAALAQWRNASPETAAQVTEVFDRNVTDPALQNIIAAGAGKLPST